MRTRTHDSSASTGRTTGPTVFCPSGWSCWLSCLLIHYPLFLFFALLQALYTRLVRGGPWAGLGKQGAFGCHPDYPCQFVFTKPYDVEKLERLFFEMVAEAGIPEEMAVFEAPDEVPADLPAPNAPIEHHHYGVGGLNYV